MAEIDVYGDADLDDPVLVEGLPGVGLVGKIATDHLVDRLELEPYAAVRCSGLPPLAVYEAGERDVHPPVRVYADADRDLLALQSDVPISPQAAPEFSECVADWLDAEGATPVLLSGLGVEDRDSPPSCFGIATGDAGALLDALDVDPPEERGAVSGPTGALVAAAAEREVDGVGLVVESDPQFPDPDGARVLLRKGVEPLTGVSVDVERLVEQAEHIREAREELARRLSDADEDAATEARPMRMFQ